jgi:hypothetical protein
MLFVNSSLEAQFCGQIRRRTMGNQDYRGPLWRKLLPVHLHKAKLPILEPTASSLLQVRLKHQNQGTTALQWTLEVLQLLQMASGPLR